MVEVERHGAFSVNGLGLAGAPFPLTFSVREVHGCRVVDATAVQASELADLLVAASGGTVVVLDIATVSFLDERYRQWSPSRIAAHQGVECGAHPFGLLADGVLGLSEEALVMHPADLPRFLDRWSPYELTLVGLSGDPDAQLLDEIGLAVGTAAHAVPILPTLPGVRVWYSGHDDCYAWLETTDPALVPAVLGRLLALQAGAALIDTEPDTATVTVPDPPGDLTAVLLGESANWIGTLAAATPASVTVRLAATTGPWRLANPLPEQADRIAVYDAGRASWTLT
jgi:hypothetical protein